MTCTDIVIVGAGAAGLAATKELQRLENGFLLLVASHRIGGRAYSEELIPSIPFDLGADVHGCLCNGVVYSYYSLNAGWTARQKRQNQGNAW